MGEGGVRHEVAGQTEPDRAHLGEGAGCRGPGRDARSRLDMIDGTPIVDIKRYSPGWDSIFSARTARDTEHPGERNRASFLRDMLFEAENFHGERCIGAALGARMVDHAIHHWGIAKKEPTLKSRLGPRWMHQRRPTGNNQRNLRQRAVGRSVGKRLRAVVGGSFTEI